MKTIALALAATTIASAPATAGTYFNAEVNNGYYGSDYLGRAIDLHIGAEGSKDNLAYYIQGGPSVTAVEGVDGTETEISGKVGATITVAQNASIYGEFAGSTNGDLDNVYNVKAGYKYKF